MASHSSASDNFSRIGAGTVIRGTVRGEGDLEIEGRVEGVVDVRGDLTLQPTARVRIEEGALSGGRITVRGAVMGSIRGETSVVLEEGARVVGDLAAPTIGIRPGGLLRGHVSTGEMPDSQALTKGRPERAPVRAPRVAAPPAARPRAAAPRVREPVAAQRVVEEPVYVEPVEAPRGRGRREAAPAPVMPALRKGAKGQMKRKGAK